jgi:hypothetical protein
MLIYGLKFSGNKSLQNKGGTKLKDKSLRNVLFYLSMLMVTLAVWSIYLTNGVSTLSIIFTVLLFIVVIINGIIFGFGNKKDQYKNNTVFTITKIVGCAAILLNAMFFRSNKIWILILWLVFIPLIVIEKKQTELT